MTPHQLIERQIMQRRQPRTLGQKQRHFSLMVAALIAFIYSRGYEVSLGDAYRDPLIHGELGERKRGVPYGAKNSFHKKRLAIDLNLFRNGIYLRSTESHAEFGEYWESLGGTWGGRFPGTKADGNHYSYGESRG